MLLVGIMITMAVLVWGIVALRYHDVVTGTAIFVVATSLFPPEYLSIKVAGLSVTADRVWLIALICQFTYDQWSGRSHLRAWTGADLWLLAFLAWLTIRTLTTPFGHELPGQPSTLMHLINGYLIPAFLYFLIRQSDVGPRTVWPAVTVLLLFGVYLSLTAVLEITKQWSLVFPGFIADPKLGLHFGRARGPMLQSVRLGMCLTLCLALLWTFPLWIHARKRWAWGVALGLTPLFSIAILLTYTRSIWMGFIAVAIVLLSTLLQGKVRTLTLGSLAILSILTALIVGPNLVAFKREYSEAETRESTYMRAAFAYVSYQMIKDSPITGFGFNQFQIHNRPYLDDRRPDVRLESIRGYVHHNSYLSLIVDLGIIGGILYTIVAITFFRSLWTIWSHPNGSPHARSSVALSLCVIAVHAIQMAFHEVSFSSIENTLLMMALGISQAHRDDLVACKSTGAAGASPSAVVRNDEMAASGVRFAQN